MPGERKTITLGIKLPTYANWEKNATLTIHGNQKGVPSRVEATASLVASCPAPFAVTPSSCEFGSVSQGKTETRAWEIRVDSVPRKPPVSVDELQVVHSGEPFQIAAQASGDSAVNLRITLTRNPPPGDHYDSVELRQKSSEYAMHVPLHVRLVEPVYVVPAKLFLRKDRNSGQLEPATALVISDGSAGSIGEVRIQSGPPWLVREDKGAVGTRNRRIRLLARGEVPASHAAVQLIADGIDSKVSFEVSVQPLE
jgi:hypothetical protein